MMDLKDFAALFPNKMPYGYILVEIVNNVIHYVKIDDEDIEKLKDYLNS